METISTIQNSNGYRFPKQQGALMTYLIRTALIIILIIPSISHAIGLATIGMPKYMRFEPGDTTMLYIFDWWLIFDDTNTLYTVSTSPDSDSLLNVLGIWYSFEPDTHVAEMNTMSESLGWRAFKTYVRNADPDKSRRTAVTYASPYKVFLPSDVQPTEKYNWTTGYWPPVQTTKELYNIISGEFIEFFLNATSHAGGSSTSVGVRNYAMYLPAISDKVPPKADKYPSNEVTLLFDEGEGQYLYDRSHNIVGYLGTSEAIESSDPIWSDKWAYYKEGNHSIYFDGVDDQVTILGNMIHGDPNSLDVEFNLSTLGNDGLMLYKPGEYFLEIGKHPSIAFVVMDETGNYHSYSSREYPCSRYDWHEVCFHWDGYVAYFILDGWAYQIPQAGVYATYDKFKRNVTNSDLIVGPTFKGWIDELRICNEVLMYDQIKYGWSFKYPHENHRNKTIPDDYASIQEAINDVPDGTTIFVKDGVHSGSGNRDIDFLGKWIVLKSLNGPKNCIIDCQGDGSDFHNGFNFSNGETPRTLVEGFTLRNMGNAIFCGGNTNPIIQNCIFENNNYESSLIECMSGATPFISNCIIRNIHTGPVCPLIHVYYSTPTIVNCLIYDNTCPSVLNSLGSWMKLSNCTIVGNICNKVVENMDSILANNIIYGNSSTNIESGLILPSNYFADPYFEIPGYWENGVYRIMDYHVSWFSPCVDMGDPQYAIGNQDIDGNQRLLGPQVDIGCVELSVDPDFNHDGTVDIQDFILFSCQIYSPVQDDSSVYDLNKDHVVDLDDFSFISRCWLQNFYYTVTVTSSPGGIITKPSNSITKVHEYGIYLDIEATPISNEYEFIRWDGTKVENQEQSRTRVYVETNLSLHAIFRKIVDEDMVLVDEGAYLEDGIWSTYVPSYYMGRYEVTNLQYTIFLNNTDKTGLFWNSRMDIEQIGSEGAFSYQVKPGKENYPVRFVSYNDAGSYAQWMSQITGGWYHLPTKKQWQKAAAWNSNLNTYRVYGYEGDNIDCSWCNFNNCYGVLPVGSFNGSGNKNIAESFYGCYDMSGNVWEWTNEQSGANYILCGGAWNSDIESCRTNISYDSGNGLPPTVRAEDIGFRIVRELDINIGLNGYWNFDEGTGPIAYDYSDNRYNISTSGLSWIDGIYGHALWYDGNKDYAEIPWGAGYEFSNGVSIQAWIMTSDVAEGGIVFSAKLGEQINGLMLNSGGTPYFVLSATSAYKIGCSSPINDGKWHHLIGTYDKYTISLYVDGVRYSVPSSGTVTSAGNFEIGKDGLLPGNMVEAIIDEVRIYDRALSEKEVQTLYLQHRPESTHTHCLSIVSGMGGTVSVPGEGESSYNQGRYVRIVAVPETGYVFSHWSGTAVDHGAVLDPTAASTVLVVNDDYSLQANFDFETHQLTISSGIGGKVSVPGEGEFAYIYGNMIQIEAVPDPGYVFSHWSGTAVDNGSLADQYSATSSVLLTGDCTIRANFSSDITHDPHLIGYWTFDEGSGNIVYDQSEHEHNGTVYGSTWTEGISGTCLNFNGGGAYVSFPFGTGYNFTSGITIHVWIMTSDSTDGGIVVSRGSSFHGLFMGSGTQIPYFGLSGTTSYGVGGPIPINDDKWHHLVGTYDNAEIALYVDGVKYSAPNTGTVITTGNFELARDNCCGLGPRRLASGNIDEVRIYDRALTEQEVQNLYFEYRPDRPQHISISSGLGGKVSTPGEGDFTYTHGESIQITAVTDTGYIFKNWTGNAVDQGAVLDPSAISTTLLINNDYSLQANFELETLQLTISSGLEEL